MGEGDTWKPGTPVAPPLCGLSVTVCPAALAQGRCDYEGLRALRTRSGSHSQVGHLDWILWGGGDELQHWWLTVNSILLLLSLPRGERPKKPQGSCSLHMDKTVHPCVARGDAVATEVTPSCPSKGPATEASLTDSPRASRLASEATPSLGCPQVRTEHDGSTACLQLTTCV